MYRRNVNENWSVHATVRQYDYQAGTFQKALAFIFSFEMQAFYIRYIYLIIKLQNWCIPTGQLCRRPAPVTIPPPSIWTGPVRSLRHRVSFVAKKKHKNKQKNKNKTGRLFCPQCGGLPHFCFTTFHWTPPPPPWRKIRQMFVFVRKSGLSTRHQFFWFCFFFVLSPLLHKYLKRKKNRKLIH